MSHEYTFQVEKGIPIPKGQSGKVYYPFPKMEVGDSFFVPLEVRSLESVRVGTNWWSKKHGIICKVSKIYNPKGTRVWRIK